MRAERRLAQLNEMGQTVEYAAVLADIQARDESDTTRTIAPLKAALDAVHIDSSYLTLDEVVVELSSVSERLRLEHSTVEPMVIGCKWSDWFIRRLAGVFIVHMRVRKFGGLGASAG